MGRYWSINCPHCNAVIASGQGYGDAVPKVWANFIRCKICGELVKTGANEFITMSLNERQELRVSRQNNDLIEKSLDRTNNTEYLDFLIKLGCEIYPLTKSDYGRFFEVDFINYVGKNASSSATQSLFNINVLIEEQEKDVNTGGFNNKVLQKNQRLYEIDRKANKWSSIFGLISGFLACSFFGSLNPDSYLFLLGIAVGFGVFGLVNYGIRKYHEQKEQSKMAITNEKSGISNFSNDDFACETREQRWLAQEKKDREAFLANPLLASQINTANATIESTWEMGSSNVGKNNSLFYSELFVRAMTAELFMKNYFLFKQGNRDDIKDNIYKERPYSIIETFINMGIYIFETKNNIEILRIVVASQEKDYSSIRSYAQQILDEEEH